MDSKLLGVVLLAILYGLSVSKGNELASPAPSQPETDKTWQVSPAPADDTDSYRSVGPASPSTGTYVRLKEPRANLRGGPGTSYPILGQVTRDSKLTVLTERNKWYQVKLPDGRVGWIASFLTTTNITVTPATTGVKREVMGFYAEDYPGDSRSYSSLLRHAGDLTALIPFAFSVDRAGNIVGTNPKEALEVARSAGLKSLALIHNMSGGAFDGRVLHEVLTDPYKRKKAQDGILRVIETFGYQGVNIDFEGVYPEDRNYLTAFMRELASKLHARGLLVTMSVPAKYGDYPTSNWIGAFDYYQLGLVVDKLVIMAYDEHNTSSGPGPVASLGWMEKVVRYAVTQLPPHKIILGIPSYGYDWSLTTGDVRALSYVGAYNLAQRNGVTPSLDLESRSLRFRYYPKGQVREVWFESPNTLGPKLDLVNRYNLGGTAIWRLGYEDPALFSLIRKKLGAR